jgi:hypothetical protein
MQDNDEARRRAAKAEADRRIAAGEFSTQEQVDQFMASQGVTKRGQPTAPRALSVPSESTSLTNRPFQKRPILTQEEEAKGLARALVGQGAMMGFGEEAEAAYKTRLGSTGDYQQEVQKIRQEMAKYKAGSPFLAPTAELVGGLATGFGLAGAAAKGATGVRGLATRIAATGAGQGAITGAGVTEGDVADRVTGALFGGTVGGALGAAAGAVARRAGTAAARGGLRTAPGVQAVEDAMESLKQTPQQLATRATQMAADSPESRVLDVLGQPGVRIGRRIEALGGEGGEKISKTMRERLGGRPERLEEVLTSTTGKARENILATSKESIARGKEASTPLYEAFKQKGPTEIPEVDAILKTPFGQMVANRARRNAANARREFIEPEQPSMETGMVDQFGNPIMTAAKAAKHYPQSLDDIKKAMDDVIYEGRMGNVQPGQGGLLPGEVGAAKQLRGEFLTAVDAKFPNYAQARAAWAGEKAVRDAMEIGEDLSKRTTKPGEIAEALAGFKDASEREFFQRGWLNAQLDKVDAGALTARQIRTPLYEKQMREVFGDQSETIMRGLLTEVELAENAGQVIGGSRTAPLQQDIAREQMGRTAEAVRNIYTTVRNDPVYAGARAFDIAREKLAGPRLAAARTEKAKTLMTPAANFGQILDALSKEYGARQTGKTVGRTVSGGVGAQGVRSLVDMLRGNQP